MDHKIRHKITKKSYPKLYGKNSLTISAIKKLKEIPSKVYEKRWLIKTTQFSNQNIAL